MKNKRKLVSKHSGKVKIPRTRIPKRTRAHLALKTLDPQQALHAPVLSTEQIKFLAKAMRAGVTRRDVLKAGAIAAGTAALPTGALAMGLGGGAQARPEVTTNGVTHLPVRFVVVRYRRSRYRHCGGQALPQIEPHLTRKAQAAA